MLADLAVSNVGAEDEGCRGVKDRVVGDGAGCDAIAVEVDGEGSLLGVEHGGHVVPGAWGERIGGDGFQDIVTA